MDPLIELKKRYEMKKEEYKQAIERHEFLEQLEIREEMEQLRNQWHQLKRAN
jgi:protein-arginine kinase activator protein McsA